MIANKNFQQVILKSKIRFVRKNINILQVNSGKMCNQACHHCHVDAGPKRKEIMQMEIFEKLISLLEAENSVHTVDITGGAPELNPNFRFFVRKLRSLGKEVIDRCNLTVLFEKGQENTAEFLAENKVMITASLPCYQEENVDSQRGRGVFQKSILALKKLNDLGYGNPGSNLKLNLVYNPLGQHLPPSQPKLEKDYKKFLKDNFGILFNSLFTITNMPISRFAHSLRRDGKMKEYMNLLIDNFNPAAANNVMCRELVSISWDGKIYDCDFNQMLSMPVASKYINIMDLSSLDEIEKNITIANHCFGCTAGSGSSCGGSLT